MITNAGHLDIYTDGSFLWPNHKGYSSPDCLGAWSYVLYYKDHQIKASGTLGRYNDCKSTNNRCEMMGIIRALQRVEINPYMQFDTITVHSDSQYALGMFTGEWKVKKGTKNLDLIAEHALVDNELVRKGTRTKYLWVEGHNGNVGNELADTLANTRLQEVYHEHQADSGSKPTNHQDDVGNPTRANAGW
ncbi:MAG: ribonuclease HI [Candidatus Dormibacteria bacterium]